MTSVARPLRVAFVISSMGVGGAETLLLNLVQSFDPERIEPHIFFLWERGPLGEVAAETIPTFDHLLRNRIDVTVIPRMARVFRERRIDAVVTVCAGDKMFWGRLAAAWAGVPVILSALHATGWPENLELLNRALTPLTSGFIAVADAHRRFLIERERLPAERVFVVRNGVDVDRFRFDPVARVQWRGRLGISAEASVVGIVAGLRPEKNHGLFVRCAAEVRRHLPAAHFIVAGDGPESATVRAAAGEFGLERHMHFLGLEKDVAGLLSAVDLLVLTSDNEASPVSILEAMSCDRPVVAPDVGSVGESVLDGETGFLAKAGDQEDMQTKWLDLLTHPVRAAEMGEAGRRHVLKVGSLASMTRGYAELVERLHAGVGLKSRGGTGLSLW